MNWSQIKVKCTHDQLDAVTAIMSMIDSGLMIEDYSDIEENLMSVYGELIDDSILTADRNVCYVSFFLPEVKDIADAIAFLKDRFASDGITYEISVEGVNEEDWANAWRKYYKPLKIGERLVVVPMWEEYTPEEHEVIVRMDPGMAFGTGTHETTRLCAALLEQYVKPGDRMLDVGCGSGILAICAAKLGAKECFACDIDPAAVRIAGENAVLNKVEDTVTSAMSDLLADVPEGSTYNVVCANIVADIIIRMSGDVDKFVADGGVVLVSGIILERCAEVRDAMAKAGFKEDSFLEENGWYAGAWVRG